MDNWVFKLNFVVSIPRIKTCRQNFLKSFSKKISFVFALKSMKLVNAAMAFRCNIMNECTVGAFHASAVEAFFLLIKNNGLSWLLSNH